ncbi:MAG: ABC transporter permease [Rhodospirillales bacterium]|nr:MAG: ABC transporter permease [Rhodospirillales bacterium]
MRPSVLARGVTGLYLLAFFGFLFGPLFIMVVTALNSSSFPRISPWDCLTFEWFVKLAGDERLHSGLLNSLAIGIIVVILSVSLGLAGALFLARLGPTSRAVVYTVITAPILIPGVVLGISTLIFWDRAAQLVGLGTGSLFYNGIFLTVLGQASFISSYCMLVLIARLQRFDNGQIEAALDLGATNVQAFRRILLPFLKPAIISAAIIAFLASFENYNTTVFTISHLHTFTTIISQKVRLGIDPSISAVAFIIIVLTLIGAMFYEGAHKRAELKKARELPVGNLLRSLFGRNPAMIMGVMVVVATVAGIWLAMGHSAEQCKADLLEQKLERQRQLEERYRQSQPAGGAGEPGTAPASQGLGAGTFGNVFDPKNLEGQAGVGEQGEGAPGAPAEKPGQSTFGNVFDPKNLEGQAGVDGQEETPPAAEEDQQ